MIEFNPQAEKGKRFSEDGQGRPVTAGPETFVRVSKQNLIHFLLHWEKDVKFGKVEAAIDGFLGAMKALNGDGPR